MKYDAIMEVGDEEGDVISINKSWMWWHVPVIPVTWKA
jgi:hypothetical protein